MIPEEKPALLGGAPVRPQGPPDWPLAEPEAAAALDQALRDGTWGKYHGPAIAALEEALRAFLDVEHVLTCGSGTYAVELALRTLGVGPGDEVVLGAYDYPGNFLTVHALGALPVLVDLSPNTWNLDLDGVAAALGPKVKAILVSHLHGGLVPMRRLMDLARSRSVGVVEDAAQCPGARVDGRRAGTWGDVGTFSFGGSKLLTAGRGGALAFRNGTLLQRARTRHLRGNLVCPLSELQAAVLLPQLLQLDARNSRRRESVDALVVGLRNLPGLVPLGPVSPGEEPAFYKVGMRFSADDFGLERDRFTEAVRAEGIALDAGFPAAHVGRSPRRYRAASELVEATRAHREAVVLHHPVLLEGEAGVAEILHAVAKVHAHRRILGGISGEQLEKTATPPRAR